MSIGVKECFRPASLEETLTLLERYGKEISICAGGTDLFPMRRKGKNKSPYLMDISELGLDRICRTEDGKISIGAMVTLTHLSEHPLLQGSAFTCLRESADNVGSQQVRNAATMGGNICTGLTSADVAVALLAMDAEVCLTGMKGNHIVPLWKFFLAPRKIACDAGELVTEIRIPAQKADAWSWFRKVGPRKEVFISALSIALHLEWTTDGKVKQFAAAMGVVAPTPVRLPKTEAFLTGCELTTEMVEEAAAIMQSEISPRTSLHGTEEYRRLLAGNLLREGLRLAAKDREVRE